MKIIGIDDLESFAGSPDDKILERRKNETIVRGCYIPRFCKYPKTIYYDVHNPEKAILEKCLCIKNRRSWISP